MNRTVASHPRLRNLAVLAAIVGLALPVATRTARAQSVPDSASVAPAIPAPAVPAADSPAVAAPAAAPVQPNAQHHPVRMVRLSESARNVVRSGPGNDYAIVGVFPKDRTFPVIAKSGDWYDVKLSDTESGWIHSSLCKEFDDLSDLEFRPNPKLYNRTGSFMLTGYTGAYSFDRKSNSLVLGGRLGYYVFDRLRAEGGVSWTHINRNPEIVESLFSLTLEAETFHMLFYYMNVDWELLPGRQMVPYLSAGVGSAIMRGESEPNFNFGGGTSLYLSKRTAVRWEVRDYRMNTGPKGARVTNHNIEFSLGTAFLF
jgi:outer membrane beta-barrel protein